MLIAPRRRVSHVARRTADAGAGRREPAGSSHHDPGVRDGVYDWNQLVSGSTVFSRPVMLHDETLRDGLQSPSITDPPLAKKIRLLEILAQMGVRSAAVGQPGAGPKAYEDALTIVRAMADRGLPIKPTLAGRTLIQDLQPAADIQRAVGIPVEVTAYIGSSPFRREIERWSVDKMAGLVRDAVRFAVNNGLSVNFVTEDTTRADPATLEQLYGIAAEEGVARVTVADTVGHATPEGAQRVVAHVRSVLDGSGRAVELDWHGHNDRGLAVANSLAALRAGADRAHGTALGIGERVGNASMEQLVVNLHLLGVEGLNLGRVMDYVETASEALGVPIPANSPVVGEDAFRTSTGVHAAAILKAKEKGGDHWADRIYSSVPASLLGRAQKIEIGPMSGLSNVFFWMDANGVSRNRPMAELILGRAKERNRIFDDADVWGLVRGFRETS